MIIFNCFPIRNLDNFLQDDSDSRWWLFGNHEVLFAAYDVIVSCCRAMHPLTFITDYKTINTQQKEYLTKKIRSIPLSQEKLIVLLPQKITWQTRGLKRDTISEIPVKCRHTSDKHVAVLPQEEFTIH